ncbi:uncharacterized protein METZ01_LOCUS276174, partial [marine metagenome]
VRIHDEGSGVARAWIEVDGAPLANSERDFDGSWLPVPVLVGDGTARVVAEDRAGHRAVLELASDLRPQRFRLGQNYPNPFNPETTIPLTVPQGARLDLTIYSATGQRVRHLVFGSLPGGDHLIRWDGRNDAGFSVASGSFFYQAVIRGREVTGPTVEVKQMALIR